MYHTGISNCALSLEQMLEDFILPRTSSRGHKFAVKESLMVVAIYRLYGTPYEEELCLIINGKVF